MLVRGRTAPLLALAVIVAACSRARPPSPESLSASVERAGRDKTGREEIGDASFYAGRHQGKPTASGEAFDKNALTAAHRSLPFGTRLEVTNLENDSSIVVRINDRGPFVRGRIVDLSLAAAKALGMAKDGVARVRLRPLR
jgi:peptidoglycan lytic transglycosylase